jgi:HlyD family secretion protein
MEDGYAAAFTTQSRGSGSLTMKKKIVVGLVVVGALSAVGFGIAKATSGSGKEPPFKLVEVKKGTVIDKALATGQIVPLQEISVKSQISGIVARTFVEVGDPVRVGQPLFAISPDATPLQLTEGQRNLELAQVAFAKAKADFERQQSLHGSGLLSQGDLDASRQAFDHARIQLDLERERLQLLKEGRIQRARGGVDSIIRAPAPGTVLERLVNQGDPVVPLTSFQAGTPLMTIADMGSLLFKGTVDEIDVGKLREGMSVRIQIGALPSAHVDGRLTKIAPKAKEQEGSTLFDVEIAITSANDTRLRAGYSANADIVIEEKKDVLTIPERLVTFENGKSFVEVPRADPKAEPEKREVKVGLSDGLNVEVVAGLKAGEKIVERPPKEIKAG